MRKTAIALVAAAMSVAMTISPLAFGWYQKENGEWGFQDKNGQNVKDMWQKSGDDWFYLDENGNMTKNAWVDGGNYYVDGNGAMMRNTVTPDGYYVGVNGKWIPDQKQAEGYTPPESITVGMQNALKTANSYMKWAKFSKKRLKDQLEFEGFSKDEANYAAETIQVDWNEECAKAAKSYMSWTGYSRKRLVEQLQFEGFTDSEVAYGVSAVGY